MPKQDSQYPQTITTLANLHKNERVLFLRRAGNDDKETQLKYAMSEFIDHCTNDKSKYRQRFNSPDGFSLADLLASQPERKAVTMYELRDDLVKMRVFDKQVRDGESWLIPAIEDARKVAEREEKKIISVYASVDIHARLTRLADARYQSLSAVCLQAFERFLAEQDAIASA